MTNNNQDLKDRFNEMIACLQDAELAAIWAFWRERYNTNHSDHVRHAEVESPMRHASANFLAAKVIYCADRDAFNQIYENSLKGTNLGELFMTMRRIVENEMDQEMEVTLDEGRKKLVNNCEEELDEDETYIRETISNDGSLWDGDDYLGDESLEDDIDWGDEDE